VLYRLAVGTAHGFGVVDYAQKKSVFEKCTLGPAGNTHLPSCCQVSDICRFFFDILLFSLFVIHRYGSII